MGARTEPTADYRGTDPNLFKGSYETANAAPVSYRHDRAILASDDWLLVRDELQGPDAATKPSVSRLHFHPEVAVRVGNSGTVRATAGYDDSALLRVHPLGVSDVRTTATEYFPEFGAVEERQTLELEVGPHRERRPSGTCWPQGTVATARPAVQAGASKPVTSVSETISLAATDVFAPSWGP
ncbi:Heparinase II/III-like protein [Haloarcula vallismortis]|uniref:Heparinase II/III-like C-terminal domain-containing protein n=2 Tax=Haloarcula vallismortis TaxID=28442 RepID=M0JI77_HALVA|nr:heparinase II/III family protein [Haloarcula vallismortis]EMA08832.1 hypothetical protein C437_07742 [Haloarcula vallismortis ATCC 29715]SDX23093.1 Heparinase II/III-like protein [Haloarcula vallismortis]